MTATLEFVDADLVHLAKNIFMWVSIKRFEISEDGPDTELLAALINHPQYVDHYAGGPPGKQRQRELSSDQWIHGPYWWEAVEPDTFEQTSLGAAKTTLTAWATEGWDPPLARDKMDNIKDHVLPRAFRELDAPTLYQLPNLRDVAEHDWGWVVGSAGFHEFVAIDRARHSLVLLVATDD